MTGIVNLEGAATAAVAKLIASGKIEKAIEDAVAETVTASVKEALRSYGEFGKQVGKAVEKALALHDDIELPSYNHAIIKIIEAQVEHGTRQSIEREVAGRMKELLTPAPESIKLSKLLEQYVEHLRDESDSGCTCYGDEVAYAEFRDRDTSGFKTLVLAKDRTKPTTSYGKRPGQIDIGLYFNRKGEETAEIYNLSFDNSDIEKQMFVGNIRGFERSIFQMRAAKTRIEIDCGPSDCDLYYGNHERV